jgi:hypothetical protein
MPRKLRATFVSLMRGARADFADLQAYIGHRPATTLSAHYDEGSMERLAAVARLAQGLAEGSGAFAEIDPETAAKTAPDLH